MCLSALPMLAPPAAAEGADTWATVDHTLPTRVVSDPDVHYGFPGAGKAPNGDILVAYRVGTTHAADIGTLEIIGSPDGIDWSHRSSISIPDLDLRDPEIWIAPTGELMLSAGRYIPDMGHQGCGIYSSDDNGRTWIPVGLLDNMTTGMPAGTRSVYLTQIITISGTTYAIGSIYSTSNGTHCSSVWSTTDGRSWQFVSALRWGCDESALLYLGGTDMLAVLRESDKTATYMGVSHDLGATWTVTDATTALGGKIWQNPMMMWADDGIALLAGRSYNDKTTAYMISRDGGATWSDYTVIDQYDADGAYISIVPDAVGDGRHFAAYYSDFGTERRYPDIWTTWLYSVDEDRPSATYVWDGEGATELASEAANWYQDIGGVIVNDVLPTDGALIIYNDTSGKDCTWDMGADMVVHSLVIERYAGQIDQNTVLTTRYDLTLDIGKFAQKNHVNVGGDTNYYNGTLTGHLSYDWTCAGNARFYKDPVVKKMMLVMTGDDVFLTGGLSPPVTVVPQKLTIEGTVTMSGRLNARALDVSGTLTLAEGATLLVSVFDVDHTYSNTGTITGPGAILLAHNDHVSWDFSRLNCYIVVSAIASVTKNIVVTATSDIDARGIEVLSDHATYTCTLDLDEYDMRATSVTAGIHGIIQGNGTIVTTAWDSSVGGWEPRDSTVRLTNGGFASLGAAQSFARLEISSEGQRTTSWTMSAGGWQNPIVTGLVAGGIYSWYLDGEEQGEYTADENGTISLRYLSSGLQSLEIVHDPMSEAMRSIYGVIPIVIGLAVIGGLITMVGRIKL